MKGLTDLSGSSSKSLKKATPRCWENCGLRFGTPGRLRPHQEDRIITHETLCLPPLDWSAHRRRLKDERGAGWLTACSHDVLKAVADLVHAGDLEPTVAKIATWAQVSVATVRRALRVARERGLLVVIPQFVQVDGRPQQRANRYALALPSEPVTPKPRPSRGDQTDRPSIRKKEKSQESMLGKRVASSPAANIDLLAAARQRFATHQRARYASRYG